MFSRIGYVDGREWAAMVAAEAMERKAVGNVGH